MRIFRDAIVVAGDVHQFPELLFQVLEFGEFSRIYRRYAASGGR